MDRDLVTAARRGDQAAFMDLVRPRSEWLFGIAVQILRDIDRAEDALQDALVIAWRDLRGLRDDRNPDVDDRTVVMQTYGPVVPSEFSASTAVIRDLIATFDFVCGPSNGGPCAGK